MPLRSVLHRAVKLPMTWGEPARVGSYFRLPPARSSVRLAFSLTLEAEANMANIGKSVLIVIATLAVVYRVTAVRQIVIGQ